MILVCFRHAFLIHFIQLIFINKLSIVCGVHNTTCCFLPKQLNNIAHKLYFECSYIVYFDFVIFKMRNMMLEKIQVFGLYCMLTASHYKWRRHNVCAEDSAKICTQLTIHVCIEYLHAEHILLCTFYHEIKSDHIYHPWEALICSQCGQCVHWCIALTTTPTCTLCILYIPRLHLFSTPPLYIYTC